MQSKRRMKIRKIRNRRTDDVWLEAHWHLCSKRLAHVVSDASDEVWSAMT